MPDDLVVFEDRPGHAALRLGDPGGGELGGERDVVCVLRAGGEEDGGWSWVGGGEAVFEVGVCGRVVDAVG